jgi:serine/threonine-protein kinase SRPK3
MSNSDYTSSSCLSDSTYTDSLTDSSQSNNLQLKGKILNNYNIISELGRGAYSIVWLGFNITDSKYYAIKVQNPDDYIDGKDEIKILKTIPQDSIYINKLNNYFIENQFVNNQIEKFVCSAYELCCGNLDGLTRKGKYKNGLPPYIVKKIFQQLCLAVNTLHSKMKIFHGDIKPDNILLCGLNNRDKKYIELYDKADFTNLYSKIKKEYWVSKGKNIKNIKKMDVETKIKIRQKIHNAIINNMEENKEDIFKFDDKYLKDTSIKLTDFGHFCPDDEIMEEPFGTQYYMAPEIILMGDCKKSVDIWALGCTLFELLTGEILFDVDKIDNDDYSDDTIQLALMVDLCGKFNQDVVKNTEFYKKYFERKNKLKYNLKKYNETPKLEQLKERLKKHNIEKSDLIADLLDKMIKLSPSKRIKINEILGHSWMTNQP